MADQNHDNNASENSDDFVMTGAGGDETLGENQNAGPRADTPVMESTEQGDLPATDPYDGYTAAVMAPPPPRPRAESVTSQQTDFNSPDVIANLVGPVEHGRRASSALSSPAPRSLNLGNSVLNRRPGQANNANRAGALSRQRKLLGRRLRRTHDVQAVAMTMTPMPQPLDNARATPSGFSKALEAYETAQFTNSQPSLKHKHKRGKLSRGDELKWIKMESLHRARRENANRGRSMTPADDDDDDDNEDPFKDPAGRVFAEIKRIYDEKKRNGTLTVEEDIEYMKVEASENARLRRHQNQSRPSSRASTPSNASGIFVDGGSPRPGFDGFGGNRGKYPRQKFFWTSKEARENAKKSARAGNLPNRSNPRAGPNKGFGDDGRGRNLEFGDYFLKASNNSDSDVVEQYLDHVAHDVAKLVKKKGTMPIFMGTPLKDRLRKIRKTWNTKTKEFCRKYDLEPPPKGSRTDEDDKRFSRIKSRIYVKMRAGQLNLEDASRFAVEANVEMCRWRAKYHRAIGNQNAATDLHDLDGVGLTLPTSEEFDEAYKPKYDKILDFVGQMFAECQDRIRDNHDRLHGIFPKVEIPDPNEPSSDEDDEEEDEETAAARAAAEEADAQANAARDANAAADDDEDENMFPDNAE